MFRMTIEDAFTIRGRGTVVTGRVESGMVRVGDEVRLNDTVVLTVDAIEAFRKKLEEAGPGENVGLLFKSLKREQVNRGDVLTAPFLA